MISSYEVQSNLLMLSLTSLGHIAVYPRTLRWAVRGSVLLLSSKTQVSGVAMLQMVDGH